MLCFPVSSPKAWMHSVHDLFPKLSKTECNQFFFPLDKVDCYLFNFQYEFSYNLSTKSMPRNLGFCYSSALLQVPIYGLVKICFVMLW